MQRISLLLIPGFIAVAVFSVISTYDSTQTGAEAPASPLPLNYNAYSEGIGTVMYGPDGAVGYTMQAQSQTHFRDDHAELEKPAIQLFRQGRSHWRIVADRGLVSAGLSGDEPTGRIMQLSGNVSVSGVDESGGQVIMSTAFLELDPRNETLRTDRAVTLLTAGIEQSSMGMSADLNTDEIVFHRDIRGAYDAYQEPDN